MLKRYAVPLAIAGLLAVQVAATCQAATTVISVSVNGRLVRAVSPGTRINVLVAPLPELRQDYCLGLASAIDRSGLPVSLGRVVRDFDGVGRLKTVIPLRLLPAEPAGPYLLFVGRCTPIAPDRPFLARLIIHIAPAVRA